MTGSGWESGSRETKINDILLDQPEMLLAM